MKKIETIFEHENEKGVTGTLGIDESGNLYWNGKKVITHQKIQLAWWLNWSAIFAAIFTCLGVIISLLEFLGYGCTK